MAEKRFKSIMLFAKHRGKRKLHLDPWEGGHRRAGMFQANFCSQLDPEDGYISDLMTYTPEHFRTATLTPNENVTAEDIIGAYNSAIEHGSKNKGFFSRKSTVHVKYLINKDSSVPKFVEACQMCSESIGREKRNSASKDVFVKIAKCVEFFGSNE